MSGSSATVHNFAAEADAGTRLLPTPAALQAQLPLSPLAAARIAGQRAAVRDILAGRDRRLLAIVGPCSLHDVDAAQDYGRRLAALADELADSALIVMRAYVEKPRTTVGWKGLLHDPDLDGSHDTAAGLYTTRALLRDLVELGLPVATELLTPLAVDYLADLLAWAAIGARTAESQTHRERVSGLDCPVGFKNGTDGEPGAAIDAIRAASRAQHYLGTDRHGRPAVIATPGNADTHLVLRGGRGGPNYDAEAVHTASAALGAVGACPRVVVDCSHANSGKRADRQPAVLAALAARRRAGAEPIAGVMLESHLFAGRQPVGPGMAYGVSITDDCLDWDATARALRAAV